MTNISDVLRNGTAGYPGADANTPPAGQGYGVPMSNVFVYTCQPITANKAAIAPLQIVSGAPASMTLSAVGTISAVVNGVNVIDLCSGSANPYGRVIGYSGGSTAVAISLTIAGFDIYSRPQTETVTSPSGAALVTGAKAFRYISAVTISGNSVGAFSVGTVDIIGLPYRADFYEYTITNWAGVAALASTNFTAASAVTATVSTGDPRGTIALPTSAANGVRNLTVFQYVVNTSVQSAYGYTPA